MMLVDKSATSISGGFLKTARTVGKTGASTKGRDDLGEFYINRQRTVTVAVRTGANNTDVRASIVWAEDI
tara:strand:+ start:716 stop:925 length:210 start_codon:yes stop_codon:yes gene_type:complete